MRRPIYCSACGHDCGTLPDDINDDPLVYCACGETLGRAISLRAFAAGSEVQASLNVVLQPPIKMHVSMRRAHRARA
jgi:hypothetical protein